MLQAASVNKITDVCMINLPFYQFFLSWNIKNVIQLRENKVVITSLNYRQILTKIPVTHYWNNLCSEIIPLFIKGRIYHNKSQINQLSSYQLYRRTDCLKPRYRIIKSKYVAIIPRHIHPKEMFLQAVCKQRSSNLFYLFLWRSVLLHEAEEPHCHSCSISVPSALCLRLPQVMLRRFILVHALS